MNPTEISVYQRGPRLYCADRMKIAGSPIVGYGKNAKEAIGDLVWNDPESFNIDLDISPMILKKMKRRYRVKR